MKLILTILLAAFMIWSSKGKKSSPKKVDMREPGDETKINGMEHWLANFLDIPDKGGEFAESREDDSSGSDDILLPEVVVEADDPAAGEPVVCGGANVEEGASHGGARKRRFDLSSRTEAQKAFIYSEIFKRKY